MAQEEDVRAGTDAGGAAGARAARHEWTWAQLGLHTKPCALLDVDGFYAGLSAFLDQVVTQGLLRPEHRRVLMLEADAPTLIGRFRAYVAPNLTKWIGPDQG